MSYPRTDRISTGSSCSTIKREWGGWVNLICSVWRGVSVGNWNTRPPGCGNYRRSLAVKWLSLSGNYNSNLLTCPLFPPKWSKCAEPKVGTATGAGQAEGASVRCPTTAAREAAGKGQPEWGAGPCDNAAGATSREPAEQSAESGRGGEAHKPRIRKRARQVEGHRCGRGGV